MGTAERNPLLTDWAGIDALPPFAAVKPHHFAPAIQRLSRQQLARIDQIAFSASEPTFENTVVALDSAGGHLERVQALFEILSLTVGTDEIRGVATTVSALLANHAQQVFSHQRFFERLNELYKNRHTLRLSDDELRLLERIHLDYIRHGVSLSPDASTRFAAISEKLAQIAVLLKQNLVDSTEAFALELVDQDDLTGLPAFVLDAARSADTQDGRPCYIFTLRHTSVTVFLAYSSRRDLREKIWRAWTARCTEAPFDNRLLMREMIALRIELAQLLGFRTFADYALADRMARTPKEAQALLSHIWEPAKALCRAELADLRALAMEIGEPANIEPWDWRYFAEKVKARKFSIDTAFVSRHFELESVIRAAFDCAHRLFGLTFHERHDVELYHSDARLWDVKRDGRLIGRFIGDYFSRDEKASGAWESEFRMQCNGQETLLPVVINSASFSRGAGSTIYLGIDDVRTIFHEFGHALHVLLSNVRFTRLSGTRVARDFVELPSHILENWALNTQLLARHALHAETGEPIPRDVVEQLQAAGVFNEGFELVRYVSCALVDMELHSLENADDLDIEQFEANLLERLGAPREAGMNMRLPHFRHVFSGDAYAAGYYGYLWAQILEADAFEAFGEAGDTFDPVVAARLHDCIFSTGNARDPAEAFHAFRGRAPDPMALIRKRGIAGLLEV